MSVGIYKVDVLPTPLVPNSIYLVKTLNSKLQIFVADKVGDIAFSTHSEEEILAITLSTPIPSPA